MCSQNNSGLCVIVSELVWNCFEGFVPERGIDLETIGVVLVDFTPEKE